MASKLKRFVEEVKEDNLTGEGAKVAFYLFLSLFPLILVLFALTGMVGGGQAFDWIMGRIEATVPPETASYLERFVRQVTHQPQAGVLSIGFVLLLWAASGGFAALADGLNRMYDVKEGRSWWKKRAVALGILIASAVLLMGGAVLVLAGPALIAAAGLGPVAELLRWPLAFIMVVALFWMIYYFLPDRDQGGAAGKVLVGALVGAALWLGATALFRLYVANFGSYSETYGFVGAVMVLMLWLYLTAVVILFGGEVAATLQGGREARREREVRLRPAA